MKKKKNIAYLSKLLFFILITCIIMLRSWSCGSIDHCENTMVDDDSSVPTDVSSIFMPRLKEMLSRVNELSPKVPFEDNDGTAVGKLILESMYTKGRVYHSMNHVFNITQNCAIHKHPLLVLATLFHDVIYYSVDKTFKTSQLELFDGVLAFEDDNDNDTNTNNCNGNGNTDTDKHGRQLHQPLMLSTEAEKDPLIYMVMRLFDMESGVPLPTSGTNEFLSAVIGVRVLSRWLSLPQLMQITVQIEGTIPFRPANADGKTAMDRLYDRLIKVATDQSEDWLTKSIHLAATMANSDLCSFDTSDRDFFLDSNWSLIPEFRPAMLDENCSLREYYDEFLALEGKTKFLHSVVPSIFQVFRNVPSDEELADKQAKTRMNLNLANDYGQVRRLQLFVLMEFVTIVGEDPDTISGRPFLSMEIPQSHFSRNDEDQIQNQDEIRELLFVGRKTGFPWDPSRCLLGAYLYDKLGKNGIDRAVEVGKNQAPGGGDLLMHLPKEVVATVASSLGGVLPSRAEAFLEIPNKLGKN